MRHKAVECQRESLILHIQSADGRRMSVVADIFRQWGRCLAGRALCRMLFVTGLGDERRATLDSLLHRIGCTGIECYPPNGVIDIICYTYGNMDGFTVRYVYCQNRPDDMDFYEDCDLHEMWKEYAPDKANRPMPRKRLDDHWSIEYRP